MRQSLRRNLHQRALHLMLSGLLAVGFLAATGRNARADLNWREYISSGDPISIIFDVNGTLGNSVKLMYDNLAWVNNGGSTQQFQDHYNWNDMTDQNGSSCSTCDRYHTRLRQGADQGCCGWGTWTMAAAHYEVWDWGCFNHRSTTFDGARETIRSAFQNRGYNLGYIYRGINNPARQCDGSEIVGDGQYVWIDI